MTFLIGRQSGPGRGRPSRRVILLGASNLVRSLSMVIETTRQVWGEPVEIMAAIGHGRSYGVETSVFGRKISGIFPCALWNELEQRPPLPTAALVTDIGNDLGYGATPECVLEWVESCLDRLQVAGATTIVTQLPMESLARVGEWRFRFFRNVLFPSCRLSLSEVVARAQRLNDGLIATAEKRNLSVIPVSSEWYGFDPIHLKRSVWHEAWPSILAAWNREENRRARPRGSIARWAYVRCLAPLERSILGFEQRTTQPSGMLRDGTTLSLY